MSPLNTIYLQRIFDKLDKDGDGLVTIDELVWFLDAIGFPSKRDELELLVGERSLDYADFLFFYESLVKAGSALEQEEKSDQYEILERDLRKAFQVFDLNGDGYISCEELQIALARLGLWDEQRGEDCRRMIDVYDTNSDGLVDFEEFKDMMLPTGQS